MSLGENDVYEKQFILSTSRLQLHVFQPTVINYPSAAIYSSVMAFSLWPLGGANSEC